MLQFSTFKSDYPCFNFQMEDDMVNQQLRALCLGNSLCWKLLCSDRQAVWIPSLQVQADYLDQWFEFIRACYYPQFVTGFGLEILGNG